MFRFVLLFTLFCLSVFSFDAQAVTRSVTVLGSGLVKVTPDQLTMTLSVRDESMELDDLEKKHQKKVSDVLSLCRRFQSDEGLLKSHGMRLFPNYQYQAEKRIFFGYIASTSITITLSSIDKYNDFISQLAAANISDIGRVSYGIKSSLAHQRTALRRAVKDARANAAYTAKQFGLKVGDVIEISNNTPGYLQSGSQSPVAALRDSGGPSAPGEISIASSITVRFELTK